MAYTPRAGQPRLTTYYIENERADSMLSQVLGGFSCPVLDFNRARINNKWEHSTNHSESMK